MHYAFYVILNQLWGNQGGFNYRENFYLIIFGTVIGVIIL
jgi:hypothetical protein